MALLGAYLGQCEAVVADLGIALSPDARLFSASPDHGTWLKPGTVTTCPAPPVGYTESLGVELIQGVPGVGSTAERIERAREAAGLSQRALASATGISQPTLSRIISGERAAKVPELVAIAAATGCTIAELTGQSQVANRARCAARATSGANMEAMRRELLHYLELDAYLDDQGIPAA